MEEEEEGMGNRVEESKALRQDDKKGRRRQN